MTLATFLFVSIACCTPASAAASHWPASTQASSQAQPNQSSQTTPASTSQPPQASNPPAQSPPAKPATPPHKRPKKKTASNCPATGTDAASASAPKDSDAAKASAAAGSCPPPKIVVQQGGTPEPGIQLAPGAGGDQGAGERDRANQMLSATEQNLKKLEGQQLTQNQQDMLKQVHQFEDQAKTAVAAGDFDRGRTLAWKAQLLSEELVNPGK